jgi:nicotinate-nucleotide adenylyltransferase
VIGLLGGAFDPPHYGHVALADEAIRHFDLDRLVVLVTGDPPHKPVYTDARIRERLARAAFADRPGVEFSAFELERDEPSYTLDTVRWAAAEWGDVIFLVGADEFADFLRWKDPDEVVRHARLGVATRPGYPGERLEPVLAALRAPDRVEFFTIPDIPISSRGLRERVARGEPIDELVPPPVARLVAELGLYRCYAGSASEAKEPPAS